MKMKTFSSTFYLIIFSLLLVPNLAFAQGTYTLQDTSGIKDSFLSSGAKNNNYGSELSVQVVHNSSVYNNSIIKYNFADSIPQGATIDSAFATFTISEIISFSGYKLRVYPLDSSWIESEVTWNNRYNSTPWDSSGGTYSSSAYDSLTISDEGVNSEVVFDITSLIEAWHDETIDNYGLIIPAEFAPTRYICFRSSEYGDSEAPKLTIYYSSPALTPPSNVSATDGDSVNSVLVTWDSVDGADDYIIYRADSSGGVFDSIGTVTSLYFNDTGAPAFTVNPPTILSASEDSVQKIELSWSGESVVDGDTCWYKVKARDENTVSDFSSADSGYIDDTISSSSAKIFTSATPSGIYSPIDSFQTSPYDHSGLSPGQTIWYRVKSRSSNGIYSALSDSIEGNTAEHYNITAVVLSQKDSSIIDSASVTITPGDSIQTTNGSGQVVFGNLPDTYTYQLKAQKNLFQADSIQIFPLTSSLTDTIFLTPLPGTLTGIVNDSLTGKIIYNALVTVNPGSYTDNTDSNGLFSISGIPPEDNYSLTITHIYYNTYNDYPISILPDSTNNNGTVLLTAKDSAGTIIDIDLTSDGTEKNLQFGFYPGASLGFDETLNEIELPPSPMSGAFFDARFTDYDSLGNGTLIDIRNNSFDTLFFFIGLSRKNPSDNISVEWGTIPDIGQKITLIELMDGIPGETVNMLSNNSHTVDDSEVNKLKIIIGPTPLTTWHMNYSAGWNLVSLGATYITNDVEFAFPTTVTNSAYYFDDTYLASSTLEAGKGYWINLQNDYDSTRTAEVIDSLVLSISEGWNMIGSISDSLNIGTDLELSAGEILSIYGSSGNEYFLVTDYLTQGNGYWINVSSAAILRIKENAGLGKASGVLYAGNVKSNKKIILTVKTDFGSDFVELNFGNFQDPARINRQNDLPPVPPFSKIDARIIFDNSYSLDKIFISENNPFETSISLATPTYNGRIILGWDNSDLEPGKYFLKDGMNGLLFSEVDMAKINELTFDANEADLVKFCYFSESLLPDEYSLHQNYPNPFNPITSIKYSIRDAGKVKLTIYNVLGQKIRTLVNETKPAGEFTVRWEATDNYGTKVAGGIYFYRLEINGITFTRKLILLK